MENITIERLITFLNEKKNYPYISFLQGIQIQSKGTSLQPDLAIIDPLSRKYQAFIDIKENITQKDKILLSKKYMSLKNFNFPQALFYVVIERDQKLYYIDFINDVKLSEKEIDTFPRIDLLQANISNAKEKEDQEFELQKEKILIENKTKFLNLRNWIMFSFLLGFLVFIILKATSETISDRYSKNKVEFVQKMDTVLSDSVSKNLYQEIRNIKQIINGTQLDGNLLTEMNQKLEILELEFHQQNDIHEIEIANLKDSINNISSILFGVFATILGIFISVWIEGKK